MKTKSNIKRPRLELRQKQTLSLKQKMRRVAIVAIALFIPVFFISFFYLNFGTSENSFGSTGATWKGTVSSDWYTAANWSPGTVPAAGAHVNINNSSGPNFPVLTGSVTISNLSINTGSIDLNGNTITVTSSANISGCTLSNGKITASSFSELKNSTLNSIDLEKTGNNNNSISGNNIFNGPVNITQNGNGYWVFSQSNGDTYNGPVTITNNSGNGIFYLAHNGTSNFAKDVTLNSSSTGGIQLGGSNGISIFAANQTIISGAYSNGPLTLNRVSQSGAVSTKFVASLSSLGITNSTLISGFSATCSAAATITNSTFKRDFSLTASDVTLTNANNLATDSGNVVICKTGGNNTNWTGGNVFGNSFGLVSITNKGTGNLVLGYSNGDIFKAPVIFSDSSSTAALNISHNGATTFNDNVQLFNISTGGINFGLSNGTTTFLADKAISTGVYSAGPLTLRNITQSGTSASDITATLTTLNIDNCTLLSSLNVVCSSIATIKGSTIKKEFKLVASDVTLTNANSLAIQEGNISITKTAGGNTSWTGGNTFGLNSDSIVIVNKGSGHLTLANSNGDTYNANTISFIDSASSSILYVAQNGASIFNGDVVLTNVSTGGIQFGGSNGSSTFAANKSITASGYLTGPLTLNRIFQTGTSSLGLNLNLTTLNVSLSTLICDFNASCSGTATINASTFKKNFSLVANDVNITNANNFAVTSGDVYIKKNAGGNSAWTGGNTFGNTNGQVSITNKGNGYLVLANTNGDTFNGTITLSDSTASSILYIAHNGTTNFNGDVQINNISTGGIQFGGSNGSSIFSGNKGLWASTFMNGPLTLNRLTQTGTSSLQLAVNPTSLSVLNSTIVTRFIVSCTGASNINGSSFKSAFYLTAADVNMLNANSFATESGGVVITKTAGGNNAWTGGNTFGNSSDSVTITNKGNGYLLLGNSTGDTFNASRIFLADSASSAILYISHSGTSNFNGNVTIYNSSSGGIQFGGNGGTSTFAPGKAFTAGSFTTGPLVLNRINQSGATALSLEVNPSLLNVLNSTIISDFSAICSTTGTINASTFKKNFTLSADDVNLTNANILSSESGNVTITKNGGSNNAWTGGNIFGNSEGITTIINNSSKYLLLANSNGDTFSGNTVFKQLSSGILYPAYNGTSNFAGDISTDGTTTPITFGSSSGRVNISGTIPQFINGSSLFPPVFRRLTMANNGNGLTLNVPARISSSLTLSSGRIITTATNMLSFSNGVAAVTSASDSSYVEGPVLKIGNQAFVFPVGRNGAYRPFIITAPSSSTDQYIAEYFNTNPVLVTGSAKDPSLHHLSQCEYWTLNRISGSSAINSGLSWGAASCGVTVVTDLRVARWDAALSRWRDAGTVSAIGNVLTGTLTSNTASSSFGYFTLASSTANNPLPISLISFTVAPDGNKAIINWQTASEKDNDYFTLERSTDGRNFEIITTVRGAGTVNEKREYSYTDETPLAGISYYQLKQTDFNGQFKYFGPKCLVMEGYDNEFHVNSISPNPFSDHLQIRFFSPEEKEIDMRIYRLDGSLELTQKINVEAGAGIYTMTDVGTFFPGIYIIVLTEDDKMIGSYKVIKQ
jgi:hypothetical protein